MKKSSLLLVLLAATSFNYVSAQITSPAPYCVATFDDVPFNVADAIKSVSFGTLTNTTNTQYAFPHYVFYNNLAVPNFLKGSTNNTLKVIFDVKGGCGYGVWIDFNQNNTFEASEKVSGTPVGTSLNLSSSTTITENVTIPTTAALGKTRMRVRIVEDDNYTGGANGYAIQPCNASTSAADVMDWGETEDYTINITGPTSVNEIAPATSFVVYPNPVVSSLNVKQAVSNNATYKVINIAGQELLQGMLSGSENQINVATLANGVYFLQLFDNQKYQGQQQFIKRAQ